MVSDASAYLAAVVLALYVFYRLRTDRHGDPAPAQRYAYGLLIALSLAMALLAPASTRMLMATAAGGRAVILLGDGVRTAAVSLLMFMGLTIVRTSVGGPQICAAVLTQLAMVVTFTAARPVLVPDGSVLVHGTGRVLLATHDLVFAGYAEWALVTVLLALAGEVRRTCFAPLRLGMRFACAACVVGIGWAAWTVDDIVDTLRTGVQVGYEDRVSNVFGALCAFLIVASTVSAKWYGALTGVRAWRRSYLMYRRLAPLWNALHADIPHIAFESGHTLLANRRPFGGIDFALYRRVIEIHDGRLALRPFAPEQAVAAERLGRANLAARSRDPEAFAEAASIIGALANRRAGHRPARGACAEPSWPGASGLVDEEAAWLARVAAAFIRIREGADPEAGARSPNPEVHC